MSEAMPSFGTIPADQMIGPPSYKRISAREQDLRNAFDRFVVSIKPGQAGYATLEGTSARATMGRIRGALKRCNLKLDRMVHNKAKGTVEVTVK